MQKIFRVAAMLLIAASLISIAAASFLNEGMWWDEAVYLGLGSSIQKGFYSLSASEMVDTFRPPVFPLIISPFSGSVPLSRMLVMLISALSIAAVYFMSKEIFGKDVALFSSLFVSTNQLFVFFSTKILSESLFVLVLSASMLFFLRRRRPANAFASGAFAGLSLMTRYLGTILLASYAAYLAYLFIVKKDREVLTSAAFMSVGFMLAVSPWLAMSHAYYGSIFGAYFDNFAVYSGSFASDFSSFPADFYGIFGLQIIPLALGLYIMLRDGNTGYRPLLLLLFALPLAFFLMTFHREPRYVLSYMLVYAMLCGIATVRPDGIGRIGRYSRHMPAVAIFICILTAVSGISGALNDRYSGESLIAGSLYLKNMTRVGDVVMTESRPYIYYFSQRDAVRFPDDPEAIGRISMERGAKFVFVYKFEPGNPPYAADYFDNRTGFERIKSFGQWGDPGAVRIYRIV